MWAGRLARGALASALKVSSSCSWSRRGCAHAEPRLASSVGRHQADLSYLNTTGVNLLNSQTVAIKFVGYPSFAAQPQAKSGQH